jgi:DNA-directed RNA polymerase II subunit RPB2
VPYPIFASTYSPEIPIADYGVSYDPQTQVTGGYQYDSHYVDEKEDKNKPTFDEDNFVDQNEISQDDLWVVISSFFDEMGLVQQQLSSFNEFIETTLNDVMEEHGNLTLDQITQNTGATYDQSVSRLVSVYFIIKARVSNVCTCP